MSYEKSYKKKNREDAEDVVIVGESKTRLVNQKLPARQLPELSFDAWWTRSQKKYSLSSEMKEVVFKHLKARGFIKSGKFDDGLKDFGIKS